MKRIIFSIVFGGIGGVAVGFALGIFFYPFWFLNDIANEQLQINTSRTAVTSGSFIQANPRDPVHWGKGRVEIFEESTGSNIIFLDKDFEVGPGPRFHVYLVDKATIRNSAEFLAAKSLDLGRLRAFRGSQIYPIPQGTDIASYRSVVIWCKEFGVLISPASLEEPKVAGNSLTRTKG